MLDLVIRGATVVTPAGVGNWDIGIDKDRIVALAEPNTLSVEGTRVLDLTGKIAIPGGIDPHVHTSWIVPTAAAEGIVCADAYQVSRAAAYGGTTTLLDFAIWKPGQSLVDTITAKEADWAGRSYVDYGYHVTFKGEIPFEVIDQIGEVISRRLSQLQGLDDQHDPQPAAAEDRPWLCLGNLGADGSIWRHPGRARRGR